MKWLFRLRLRSQVVPWEAELWLHLLNAEPVGLPCGSGRRPPALWHTRGACDGRRGNFLFKYCYAALRYAGYSLDKDIEL